MLKILDVLQYLGSLRPPVIHRDIKPENIIWDATSRTVCLVDFGAVQDAVSITMIGSTVVGTYGYMAPEQFQNRASLQTDLYGLGSTILYILSGRSPSSFPQKRLKIDFRGLVPMSSHFADIIEGLLEPVPEDRFQAWNAFVALWTGSAVRMGAPLFFTLFSLPFWFVGIRLARRTISGLAISVDLNFGIKEFSIAWKLGNLWSYGVKGQTRDIISAGIIIEAEQNGQPITTCCLKEGVKSHTFGVSLEPIEKEWLVQEINDFLGLEPPQQDHLLSRKL